jgi:hypothetical protein
MAVSLAVQRVVDIARTSTDPELAAAVADLDSCPHSIAVHYRTLDRDACASCGLWLATVPS